LTTTEGFRFDAAPPFELPIGAEDGLVEEGWAEFAVTAPTGCAETGAFAALEPPPEEPPWKYIAPPITAAKSTAIHAAIKIQFVPDDGLWPVAASSSEGKTGSAIEDSGRLVPRVAPPERLPNVLRATAEEGAATGAGSGIDSDAEDEVPASAGKASIGVCAGGAGGNSSTLLTFDFAWGAGFFTTSMRGVIGEAGLLEMTDAAGCTSSCEPIEMNGASGLAAVVTGGTAAGGFGAGVNELGSTGLGATGSGVVAGAQEISDADVSGVFLIAGGALSAAIGCAGLFAGAGPSDGK
jgi:hypothetical protein